MPGDEAIGVEHGRSLGLENRKIGPGEQGRQRIQIDGHDLDLRPSADGGHREPAGAGVDEPDGVLVQRPADHRSDDGRRRVERPDGAAAQRRANLREGVTERVCAGQDEVAQLGRVHARTGVDEPQLSLAEGSADLAPRSRAARTRSLSLSGNLTAPSCHRGPTSERPSPHQHGAS